MKNIALLVLLLWPVFSLSGQRTAGTVRLEQVTLQLKWKHQFQFAGYYAAVEQGYYRQEGLQVQLKESPAAGNAAMEVVQGRAQFGIATSDLLLLHSRGIPVVALAVVFQHSPLILLARRSAHLQSVHDLTGKRVMFEDHADELRAYLRSESVPLSKIKIQSHSYSPKELIAGGVDAITAYSIDEPYLLRKAGVPYLIFTPRSGGIDFYGDTLFTTEKMLRKKPQTVRRFVRASLRGWEYALQHPERIVDLILRKYSKRHSREHLLFEARQTKRLILPELVNIGYMHHGRWKHMADTYASLGMMPTNYNLENFIFNPEQQQGDHLWLYYVLAGAVLVTGSVAFSVARFYRMNQQIRRENKQRRRVEERLRGLQERYKLLVENAPFPIVISLLDGGRVLFLNPAAATLFQIDRNYAVGKYTREFYDDPDVRPEVLGLIRKQGYLDRYQLRLLTGAGKSFWAELSARVIEYEGQDALFLALQDINAQKELEEALTQRAVTDELTGLWNRRRFIEAGLERVSYAERYNSPLSMLMIDLDFFKQVNDNGGHAAGDTVLRRFSRLLEENLRESDSAGRLGGEEFAVLLPNTEKEPAAALAERVRKAVEQEQFRHEGRLIRMTVSIGVAAYCKEEQGLDKVLQAADRALYRAKKEGRNRVAVAD